VSAAVPHFRADTSVEDLLGALDEVGVIIVEGMLDGSAIDGIAKDLETDLRAADPEMKHLNPELQFFYTGVRNVTSLTSKSPVFVDSLLLHPLLLGLADEFFRATSSGYLLNVAHLLVREPGADQQFLHRDEDVWVHLQNLLGDLRPHPEVQLSSVTALADFTRASGATAVVPGSHLWTRGRQPEESEIAYAEMPAGSSIIYRGSVIHAGGTNGTDRSRPGLHLSFVVGWLRTEEANVLATPPEVARSLPVRAQQLLGYECHDAIEVAGGYTGMVDLRNPMDLLASGEL
jgi:hypothetical protein